MDYLEFILNTFQNHRISRSKGITVQRFPISDKHTKSQGLKFENNLFGGEIFIYMSNPDYCEIEFLAFDNEKFDSLIVEFKDKGEIEIPVQKFLDSRLEELKLK